MDHCRWIKQDNAIIAYALEPDTFIGAGRCGGGCKQNGPFGAAHARLGQMRGDDPATVAAIAQVTWYKHAPDLNDMRNLGVEGCHGNGNAAVFQNTCGITGQRAFGAVLRLLPRGLVAAG